MNEISEAEDEIEQESEDNTVTTTLESSGTFSAATLLMNKPTVMMVTSTAGLPTLHLTAATTAPATTSMILSTATASSAPQPL